jgi:hypothetical protein
LGRDAHKSFRKNSDSPIIQKMYEVLSQPLGKLLTPEQLKEQEELAIRIVKELISRERTDDLSELAKELKLQLGS